MNKLYKKDIEEVLALTPMQEGMLFHYLKNPETDWYFEQLCLDISGEMGIEIVENAWNIVVQSNEMLRTVFRWEELEKPVQVVLKEHKLKPGYYDLTGNGGSRKKWKLEEIKGYDKKQTFDLRDVPFRVTLCKLKKGNYAMIISNHHILYDGWSSGILLKEFFSTYNNLAHGGPPVLPVKTKFKEFVKFIGKQDTHRQENFWKDYLKDFFTGGGHSSEKKKRKEIKSKGNHEFELPFQVKNNLEHFVKKQKISSASLLYCAWGILLQKYNSCNDVLFDTTVSGRTAATEGIENIVGLFINTLPLRVRAHPGEEISHLLSRVNQDLRQRGEFENSSLLHINEYLDTYYKENLFDSVVVIENYPLDLNRLLGEGNSTLSALSVNTFSFSGSTSYDLTVIITPFEDYKVNITYNEELFDRESLLKLCNCFSGIVHDMLTDPANPVNKTGEVEKAERNRLLAALNNAPHGDESRETPYIPPRDGTERELVKIWADLLRVDEEKIGVENDFFDFGGHSLKASVLASRIHREFKVKIPPAEIFKRPTVNELAQYIRSFESPCPYVPVEPVEEKEYYLLSPAQKRLYMLLQLNPGSTAYNGPFLLKLEGRIDKGSAKRIEQAFQKLITRHESLRTSFVTVNGEPVQKVRGTADFEIEYHDLTGSPFRIHHFVRPFDLSKAPLMRVGLIKIREEEHILVVDMHHLITDGTSVNILTREFTGLYRGDQLPPVNTRYKDYTHRQNRRLDTGELKQQETYWLNLLTGEGEVKKEVPVLDMPTDYPRPAIQSFEGARIPFELGGEPYRELTVLMRDAGTTLYMVLLAVYTILLSRHSGREDIVVGTPAAGRNHPDLENIIGFFLETLVMRNCPTRDKTFAGFLKEIKATTLNAYENQDYPFGELIKQLPGAGGGDGYDLSRNPLFDVMLNVLNQESSELEMGEIKVTPFHVDPGVSKVDITLEAVEAGEKVTLELEYGTALFKRDTMERFSQHFINIAGQVARNPMLPLSGIEIMSEREKKQVLEEFNNTRAEGPGTETVHRSFEARAAKTPDSIAVSGAWKGAWVSVTYGKLNEESNRLARRLNRGGVQPGGIAGLMVERSPAVIIGVLGILKSGGAYLPLDPGYPKDRIEYMLKDSNPPVLLTETKLKDTVTFRGEVIEVDAGDISNPVEVIRPDHADHADHADRADHADHAAYIIYTSGSTGKPKGVMVGHENISAYLHAFAREFDIKPGDVVIQQASYSFDAFGEEVFPCLLKGGRLVIPSMDEIRDTALLSRFIRKHGIRIIDCSPLLLNELNKRSSSQAENAKNPLRSIHTFISGGDVLKREYIDELLKIGTVYNTYGPTETTICATYHKCSHAAIPSVPIGKPITDYGVFILDRELRPQPIGIPGEICIRGAGVTAGYLNRPELTAEKFVPCPWFPGERMYRTGDLGKWSADGGIEFLGRIDRQVNIRGFRIEPGEIESLLLGHEDIEDVAAVPVKENAVCAYFVSREEKTIQELKNFLSLKLPDHMIPAHFVRVEQVPLTAAGKVDVEELPEPLLESRTTNVEYAAPENETEMTLVNTWKEILGLGTIEIGTNDNFFDLGGDSISANQAIARIREELQVEISLRKFFESPFVKTLAEEIEKMEHRVTTIPRASRAGEIPLSFAQERLWFLQELSAENVAYFVPRVIRMKGKLDITLLERTFTEIVRRHEILRTVFPISDGPPVQRILPPYPFKIPVFDWTGRGEEFQNEEVSRFLKEEGQRPFNFETGPLLRVTLIKLNENESILVLTEHHLIHDGWTQGVLLKEFIAVFTAYTGGRDHDLSALPIQYADYAVWQRNYLQGEVLEHHLTYWKRKLSGLSPVLKLPADRPRPSVISGEGALNILRLPGPFTHRLKNFSRENGVTLFMTMLAVFKTFLYRYTGVGDLCVGTGIANRRHKEIEGMLGMVINTLPLRTAVSGDISFHRCLHRVKETCLEAYQHEDTPFGKIVEMMRPERSLGYVPLFQVMFSFMDTPTEALRLPGLELEMEESHNRSSKFDINIVVVPPGHAEEETGPADAGETLVEWEYNTDIFDAPTVERMVGHFTRLLEAIVHTPGKTLSSLPMPSESETRQLLYTFNETTSDYPKNKTIHQLFEEQTLRAPDAAAVLHSSYRSHKTYITYSELNRQAHRLAALLNRKGVQTGSPVGIMVKYSVEMIVGILGILTAGGAYQPIDADYPASRISYMLKDSGAAVLLTTRDISPKPTFEKEIIYLENDKEFPGIRLAAANRQRPADLAYIMYTSGSTGRPKGVMVTHKNVVRLVKAVNYVRLSEETRILQTGAPVFDAATFEIWGSLLNGGRLVLTDKETILDADRLAGVLKKYKINTLWLSSSLFNRLAQQNIHLFAPLGFLLVGGDVLSPGHINRVKEKFPGLKIINGYGPTENTTFSTTHLIEKTYPSNIPIGSPISNSTAYILDKNGFLQPIGVGGELWVGGDGVSMGYLNSPELTAERFKFNRSYNSHTPLYRTGDLARWLPDGNIEFLGRMDKQVKLRGLRIEPGEIESHLVGRQSINEAVVIAGESSTGDKYLCGYVVPADGKQIDIVELRNSLSENLPHYMIPAYFVQIHHIPLTPNGKVDRESLPDPKPSVQDTFTPPRNPVEERLADIWGELLGIEKKIIGIDANFFELGGHSVKVILLVSKIHKIFNKKPALADIFKDPTIRGLSRLLENAGVEAEDLFTPIEPAEKRDYYPLSRAQSRLYILQKMESGNTAYNIPAIFELGGAFDGEKLENIFLELVTRHESLRTSFHMVDGKPVQRVYPPGEAGFSTAYYDISQWDKGIEEIIVNFIKPFDPGRLPLLRLGIVTTPDPAGHFLILDMHHLISDGFSMGIFAREFMALYNGETLPGLRLQYKDFAVRQSSEAEAERMAMQKQYWMEQFHGEVPELALPTDYQRPAVHRFEGQAVHFEIPAETVTALKELAFKEGASLFMVLLAAYYVWLFKLTGSEDIVVGTSLVGRRHADLNHIMGLFFQTLALRCYPGGEKPFITFLEQLKGTVIPAFENQDFAFDQLVRELMERGTLKKDTGRNPLFNVMFALQNFDRPDVEIPGLKLTPYEYDNKTAKFDLFMIAMETGDIVTVKLEYAEALFNRASVENLARRYNEILEQVLEKPEMKLDEITLSTTFTDAETVTAHDDFTAFEF